MVKYLLLFAGLCLQFFFGTEVQSSERIATSFQVLGVQRQSCEVWWATPLCCNGTGCSEHVVMANDSLQVMYLWWDCGSGLQMRFSHLLYEREAKRLECLSPISRIRLGDRLEGVLMIRPGENIAEAWIPRH